MMIYLLLSDDYNDYEEHYSPDFSPDVVSAAATPTNELSVTPPLGFLPRDLGVQTVNISVAMVSRRTAEVSWRPRAAFVDKDLELVFAPQRAR